MNTRAWIIIPVLLMSACTQYTLVEPQPQKIGDFYTVAPQIHWSREKQGAIELWTVDGPALQAIRFFSGIEDGESMFPATGADSKLPSYRSGMTAIEVEEFVIDTLARLGGTDVQAANLRPFQFGRTPGFRFEFTFLTREGLEFEGMAAGAEARDRLYLILYTGARSHYFGKHKNDVERIFESIQTSA
ncbi:MAG TPA: hypothetical protein VGB36_12550 [Gammaproteobacteria bacterium]